MDYTKWHVGMRVVCVLGGERWAHNKYNRPPIEFPCKGAVYTIRDVSPHPYTGQMAVRLVEIVNPEFLFVNGWFGECGFGADRFRPVDESRLDIFRSILTDAPKHAETVE